MRATTSIFTHANEGHAASIPAVFWETKADVRERGLSDREAGHASIEAGGGLQPVGFALKERRVPHGLAGRRIGDCSKDERLGLAAESCDHRDRTARRADEILHLVVEDISRQGAIRGVANQL